MKYYMWKTFTLTVQESYGWPTCSDLSVAVPTKIINAVKFMEQNEVFSLLVDGVEIRRTSWSAEL